MYLHMYNNFTGVNGLKADAFLALMKFCERLQRLDIMISQLRSIESTTAKWSLSPQERRHLYREVSCSLDKVDDPEAFKVMHAYLRLFQNEDKKQNYKEEEMKNLDSEARRCVILAIKARNVINFEELLHLNAIKKLTGEN